MSAKCGQCGEPVSRDPYPDEKHLDQQCDGYCGQWLCIECSDQQGGICSRCKRGLAE